MALYKRGRVYHFRFRINGRRYRGSTKKTKLTAARRIEALTMAQAEERGGVLLLRRSPVLGEFSKRFLDWVNNQSMLKQKSKDYYANGWRLLADTDVAGMRLDANFPRRYRRTQFSGWPVEPQQCTSHASAYARQSGRVENA